MVEVIKYNQGDKEDINDNKDFLGFLDWLNNEFEEIRLEEYFHNFVCLYEDGDRGYYIYFTVEHDIETVDGYIIFCYNLEDVIKLISEKRSVPEDSIKQIFNL